MVMFSVQSPSISFPLVFASFSEKSAKPDKACLAYSKLGGGRKGVGGGNQRTEKSNQMVNQN